MAEFFFSLLEVGEISGSSLWDRPSDNRKWIIPAVLPKWEYILQSIGRSLALHLQKALQPRDNRKWNHNSWPARRPDLFSSLWSHVETPCGRPRGNRKWNHLI